MTGAQFIQWLAAMKAAGLGRSDRACVLLLGMHENSVTHLKANGADRRTALACTALLHRMEPYGGDGK